MGRSEENPAITLTIIFQGPYFLIEHAGQDLHETVPYSGAGPLPLTGALLPSVFPVILSLLFTGLQHITVLTLVLIRAGPGRVGQHRHRRMNS